MKKDSYFPAMIAALIIIALAVASLIYSLVKKGDPDSQNRQPSNGIVIEKTDDGMVLVDPGEEMRFPQSPPNVPKPTSPPPEN